MERRNLELATPMTPQQWDMVARTARELEPVDGFDWKPGACNEIEVYMREEDAPGAWRDWIVPDEAYGAHPVRVATVFWNDGDPYARNDLQLLPESPNVLPQDAQRMQAEYEHWVHNAWRRLRQESGLPYIEAGNIEQV